MGDNAQVYLDVKTHLSLEMKKDGLPATFSGNCTIVRQ
jgi:hypothetical protein